MRNRPTVTQMFPLIRVVHVFGLCRSDIGIGSKVTKMLGISTLGTAARSDVLRQLHESALARNKIGTHLHRLWLAG